MFLPCTAVATALLKAWEERRYQPVIIEVGPSRAPDSPPLGSGGFARELERLGATQLLVHGIHDAEGRAISLFTFACRPGSASQRQAYLVQLPPPGQPQPAPSVPGAAARAVAACRLGAHAAHQALGERRRQGLRRQRAHRA